MDEQGIYCPQCRAYVHFWCLSDDGRPPAGAGVKGIVPGTPIDMFESCKQCGFKGSYKTSDLRTRRIPTEPGAGRHADLWPAAGGDAGRAVAVAGRAERGRQEPRPEEPGIDLKPLASVRVVGSSSGMRTARRAGAAVLVAAISTVWVSSGCRGRGAPQATPASASSAKPADGSAAASPSTRDRFSRRPRLAAMTELGRQLFFDPQLSRLGKMSCATCHDPRFAYGPPNARSTQLGGLDLQERRPPRRPGFALPADAAAVHRAPLRRGGRRERRPGADRRPRLGRPRRHHARPGAAAADLAVGDGQPRPRSVVAQGGARPARRATSSRVRRRRVLRSGAGIDRAPACAWRCSSRARRTSTRTAAATTPTCGARGRSAPASSAAWPSSTTPRRGTAPAATRAGFARAASRNFTDFGYNAIGVPRNRTLPANARPRLPRPGALRPRPHAISRGTKSTAANSACRRCATSALRRAFFHNGVFHRLEQVLDFYVARDTNPGQVVRAKSAARSTRSTICRPPTARTSTAIRRSAASPGDRAGAEQAARSAT